MADTSLISQLLIINSLFFPLFYPKRAIAKPTSLTACGIFQLPQCCSVGSVTELSHAQLLVLSIRYQLTTTTNLLQTKRRLRTCTTQISLCRSSIRNVEIKRSSMVITEPCQVPWTVPTIPPWEATLPLPTCLVYHYHSTGRQPADVHPLPTSSKAANLDQSWIRKLKHELKEPLKKRQKAPTVYKHRATLSFAKQIIAIT